VTVVSDLERVVARDHHDPHAVLGPHPHGGAVTVRTLRPWATSVAVLVGDQRHDLRHESYGVWVGVLDGATVPDYRLEVAYDGPPRVVDDPYRFLPTLGEIDLPPGIRAEALAPEQFAALSARLRASD